MSKITLSSNPSGTGTFTIASPNSSTDRTLTLPDAAGTVVTDSATQTLTNKTIDGSQLVDGSVPTAKLPFTPVQQGGGTDMGTNKVYIGWRTDGKGLQVEVDVTPLGCLVRNESAAAGDNDTFFAPGSAPLYACRAWVNFNGTGAVAIRASGNVSSIIDLGTGTYGVSFTNAMPDANYAVTGTSGNAALSSGETISPYNGANSATQANVATCGSSGAVVDRAYVTVIVIR